MRRHSTDGTAISRFAQQRHDVLSRAVHALDPDREIPIEAQPDVLRETTALLATSLEALKAAEAELMQQNQELLRTREAIESTSRHYRRLFDEGPLPYVVTDICGIIRHANRAATRFLRQPAELLERKPLLAFVPFDRRGSFRDAFDRLQLVDEARDWRMKLLRHGDAPAEVSIDVKLSRAAHDGDDFICWVLRPTEPLTVA
jgi:PAS domain-containing protein